MNETREPRPLPATPKPTGPPEPRNIGWDGAGNWLWAAVIPCSPSQQQPWPTYKPLARFQTKADAEAYIALLTTPENAEPPVVSS
jgi:hypothetical protein